MTNQIDQIVEHLFHKPKLEDVSIYELERFIATHPYFAAGHLLLAKKSQADRSDDTDKKMSNAALYYSNPLWLQWLFDQDPTVSENKRPASATYVHAAYEKETPGDLRSEENTDQETVDENAEPVQAFSDTDAVENITSGNHFENIQTDNPVGTESLHNVHEQVAATHDVATSDIPERTPGDQNEFLEEKPFPDATFEADEKNGNVGDEITQNEFVQEPSIEDPVNKDQAHTDAEHEQTVTVGEQAMSTDENDVPGDGGNTDDSEESKAVSAGIEKSLSSATLIPTRAEVETNEFSFEPYHTIDYFASQGIKLQQSDLSRDKFGKQLKSFTEWLRSMKRLPQTAVDGSIDEATQQSIQRIAEHSFEEKDIVTETMAEVWIKQGNKEKAIDTLNKLSLQNPSKSHYFAAKIEQLKAS